MTHRSKRQQKGGERTALPLMCQCPGCNQEVTRGEIFCAHHKTNGCPTKSPLTGAEPHFAPDEYNGDRAIQHSHNCFAYAMNVRDGEKIKSCRERNACRFHVPGKSKGHPDFSGKMGKTCSDVIGRTMADVPEGYLIDFSIPCKKGFSKIAVVVDEDNDLHYYRQDSNGFWSHKPGGRPVTDKDAVGAKIYDPRRASRYYPKEDVSDTGLNYDSFCSYMCVPRDKPPQVAGGKTRRRNK